MKSKDAIHTTLVNGDAKPSSGSSSVSNSGPPVVSITSGQPFMEAPSSNGAKQSSGNVSTSVIIENWNSSSK